MCYKTILVHVDAAPSAAERVAVAARLAHQHDAHLVGAALTGYLPEYLRAGGPLAGETAPDDDLERLTLEAQQALDRFERQAESADARHERRLSDDDAAAGLVLQARYADLVVLSQSDGGRQGIGPGLPESVALHGGRPVLVVPYAGAHPRLGRHALVAWDGGRAATRAIGDALPLLRLSERVTVAVFNPGREYGAHGDQPGADIVLLLARHGVRAEALERATAPGRDVGEALLSLAADVDADVLVMGAYGHLRWREIVLGGATRAVLRATTLPVLMSH